MTNLGWELWFSIEKYSCHSIQFFCQLHLQMSKRGFQNTKVMGDQTLQVLELRNCVKSKFVFCMYSNHINFMRLKFTWDQLLDFEKIMCRWQLEFTPPNSQQEVNDNISKFQIPFSLDLGQHHKFQSFHGNLQDFWGNEWWKGEDPEKVIRIGYVS
jgi:hypothetical protein